jgi:hypothetical protein
MEQIMALGVEPGGQDSAAKCLAAVKSELAVEKAAWEIAPAEPETFAGVVGNLKKTADKLTTHVPILEEKGEASGQQGP